MAVKKSTMNFSNFKFDKDGLIPVVAQDYESGEVLMLVYMNKDALEKTFTTGYAHYYSRSKKTVTKYGEVTGNTQKVVVMALDHDNDSLLLKVIQKGNADAEKNTFTCFNNRLKGEYNNIGSEMFGRLQRILSEVRKNPETGAYTSFLFVRGVDRIGKKVGEEAVELVIAAKNGEKIGIVNEAADLLYHVMVLLNATDVKISEVCNELCKRNR